MCPSTQKSGIILSPQMPYRASRHGYPRRDAKSSGSFFVFEYIQYFVLTTNSFSPFLLVVKMCTKSDIFFFFLYFFCFPFHIFFCNNSNLLIFFSAFSLTPHGSENTAAMGGWENLIVAKRKKEPYTQCGYRLWMRFSLFFFTELYCLRALALMCEQTCRSSQTKGK